MSSPNGDSAGTPQRKSMRTRHKKSLGDDFIDPTAVSRVERFSTNKRKGISHSPAPSQELQGTSVPSGSSVSKLEGTVIKEEIEKESYSKEPEGPRRSNRQLRPSMKIKIVEEEALIAQMELKQEKSVSPIELKPEVKTDVFRPFPYDLTTDPYLIARCEPKITVHQKLRHPPNYVFEKRPRPINRLPSKQYNTTFADMESALDKGVITVDEERRLNEEADERVAAIRAASVQKILAKRSLGKVSTGSQKAAQNEEISRYVASTKNPVLVASPCEFPDEDVSQQIFERPAPRQIQSHQMTEEEQRIFAYAKKIAAQEAAQPITSPPLQPEQALKINSDRNDDTNVKPRSVAETETMRQGYELVRLEDQKPRQLLVRTRNPFPGLQYEPLPEPPKKKKKSEETNNLPPLLQQRLPGPGGFRTVTVMPHSMHYDADGNPAGPSTESTATQRTIKYKIVTNTTGGQSRPQVHRIPTAVVAKGPDGKPLPPRRLVVMNPAAFKQKIQQPKIDQSPTTEVERDKYSVSPSSPGQSNNSNIVSVKFIKDKNAYKTAFATGAKNLHPHQPQVVLEEERMVEVKQEVVEVKGEPPEEFDGAPILQQEIISEEPRTNQLPLDPNFAVRRVLIFRQKETPLETIDVEPLEDLNECERSPSPDRFYLGAEEPMKDFDEDQYRYNRYSVKVVKEFSAKLLRPFGKRPPGMAHKKLEPGAPGMSSVLVADLDVQKYEIELAKEKEEEKKVKEEKDKFFTRESLRQQQARAARLNVNEMRIWQYMQTERFRELYKPHGKLGPFEEMTMDSDGMASFHESLSKRNPELFNDLLRIVTIKKQDKCNQAQLYPVRSYNRLHTPRASGPIRLERSLAEDRSKKPVPPQGPPNLVKVIWKGVTGKVPEWIPCHLCRELMRLCMRKSNYRGELREYPAYR
uniref:Uncharacterized protein n=1 Tax=Caenorhabditis japonica TaxID=281687 RepID=A0A8R1DF63_CAEJA